MFIVAKAFLRDFMTIYSEILHFEIFSGILACNSGIPERLFGLKMTSRMTTMNKVRSNCIANWKS